MTSARPLTDPRAIGWPLLVMLVTILAVDQVATLGSFGQAADGPSGRMASGVGARLAGGIAGVGAMFAVLLLARVLWLRTAWARRRRWVTVVTVALATLVGASVPTRIALLTGWTPRPVGPDEVFLVAALTLACLPMLARLAEHRETIGRLRTAAEQLAHETAAVTSRLAAEHARMHAEVRTLVTNRLGPAAAGGTELTARRLRELVDDVVRPLSHRLGAATTPTITDTPAPADRAGWRASLRDITIVPDVRPRLLAIVMTVLTFRLSISDGRSSDGRSGPAQPATDLDQGVALTTDWASVSESLLQHLATFVVVLIGTRILARGLRTRVGSEQDVVAWSIVTVGLVAIGAAAFATIRAIHLLPPFSELAAPTFRLITGFVVPLLLVTAAASILTAVDRALTDSERRTARANRAAAVAAARTAALLAHERREFARRLHSTVQATVNAGSLLLERAAHAGAVDPDVVARVATMIDTSLADLDGPPSVHSLPERLERIAGAWEGLAAVDIHIAQDAERALAADGVAASVVADLAAEACANAVIHGRAANIRVAVTTDCDAVQLDVEDDGTLRTDDVRRGLGSTVLDELCAGWSLDHRPHGTTLTATIPLG